MNCSTPGLPVHDQLLELTQTHVHWVGDDIQPSHPLSSPSSPAFNLSQHQSLQLFTSDGQSIRASASASASVLPVNFQDWFPLGWTGWISLPSKGLSRVFSNATVQKHHTSNRIHHAKYWAGWSTCWNQIAGRNTNNFRYADGTTLIAESEKELKSLLIRKTRVKKLAWNSTFKN